MSNEHKTAGAGVVTPPEVAAVTCLVSCISEFDRLSAGIRKIEPQVRNSGRAGGAPPPAGLTNQVNQLSGNVNKVLSQVDNGVLTSDIPQQLNAYDYLWAHNGAREALLRWARQCDDSVTLRDYVRGARKALVGSLLKASDQLQAWSKYLTELVGKSGSQTPGQKTTASQPQRPSEPQQQQPHTQTHSRQEPPSQLPQQQRHTSRRQEQPHLQPQHHNNAVQNHQNVRPVVIGKRTQQANADRSRHAPPPFYTRHGPDKIMTTNARHRAVPAVDTAGSMSAGGYRGHPGGGQGMQLPTYTAQPHGTQHHRRSSSLNDMARSQPARSSASQPLGFRMSLSPRDENSRGTWKMQSPPLPVKSTRVDRTRSDAVPVTPSQWSSNVTPEQRTGNIGVGNVGERVRYSSRNSGGQRASDGQRHTGVPVQYSPGQFSRPSPQVAPSQPPSNFQYIPRDRGYYSTSSRNPPAQPAQNRTNGRNQPTTTNNNYRSQYGNSAGNPSILSQSHHNTLLRNEQVLRNLQRRQDNGSGAQRTAFQNPLHAGRRR